MRTFCGMRGKGGDFVVCEILSNAEFFVTLGSVVTNSGLLSSENGRKGEGEGEGEASGSSEERARIWK